MRRKAVVQHRRFLEGDCKRLL